MKKTKSKTLFSTEGHGGNIREVKERYGLSSNEILDFSASINPLGYPPGLKDYLFEKFDSVLHYPDIHNKELVEALANYHGLEKFMIVVANGSTEIIHLIPQIFSGKKALIIAPAFSEYEKGLVKAGYDVRFFLSEESKNFIPNVQDILANVLNDPVDILFLANPGSPAGSLIPLCHIEQLIKGLTHTNTLVILDEVFIDFIGEHVSAKELIRTYENVLIIRSMTKFFGFPGLRLGYLLASKRLCDKINSFSPPWRVGSLAQLAGPYSLRQKDYIQRTREVVSIERERLFTSLASLAGVEPFPGSANYLLIKINIPGVTASQLREILLPSGIIIRDCSTFQNMGNTYFRVAVRLQHENTTLVNRLHEALCLLK